MKTLKEYNSIIEIVKTKSGAVLHKINIDKNHFFLEQNPLKDSKYGNKYRILKEKNPNFYMFWEIKNDEYTGKVLTGFLMEKEDLDKFLEVIERELT